MKNLLKIFLISSSIYACNSSNGDKTITKEISYIDSASSRTTVPGDDVTEDAEKEKTQKITSALLSSKQEIMQLQTELTDSLIKSGLNPEKKSLFRKTLKQLEAASEQVNKQLEQILVTDLTNSQNKLKGIVNEMKASEKKLGEITARLDKITNFMQVAVTLIQSLKP